MARYQIVYTKSNNPMTTWCDNADRAIAKAEMFERVGYNVTIWEHTKQGATPYKSGKKVTA